MCRPDGFVLDREGAQTKTSISSLLGIEQTGMSDSERDLLPGALEMMVLQILLHGPMYGYASAQRIKQSSGDLLPSPGSRGRSAG